MGECSLNTDRITELAKAQGKTLTYLCALVGRPRYYLKSVRSSGTSIPREYLEAFAADLGTTVEYLLGETDDAGGASDDLLKNTVTYYRNEQKVVKRLKPDQMKMLADMIDGIRTDE